MQNAKCNKKTKKKKRETKPKAKKCRREQNKFSDFVYAVEEFWGCSHLLGTVTK